MLNIHFVPECFAETEMVKQILDIKDSDYLNHADGIHKVSKILKNKDVQGYLNIGFIDKDKYNNPPYFDEFETIEEHSLVIFKKHPNSNDYIFMVKPAIEMFILLQLPEISKEASDYNFPNDLRGFCKQMKSMHLQYNDKYKEMILDLKNANTSGIAFIINKVTELRNQ